ncbi:hypothetical protein [Tetragenococcus halophilus]|uniref:hypothetical protein n=1 Tax=Tetragenococcus halophilus TaxID=51669 RepID=UPI00077CBEC3|nr:hypothetical protein [Tetragenococcus halophilus]
MDNKELSKQITEEIKKAINEIDETELDFTQTFFTQGKELGKTAYLNWRFDKETSFEQFCTMGDAYFEPQYYLLWELLNTDALAKSDAWMFPIIFNTIHGIECYLKGILGKLNIVTQLIEGERDENKLKFGFEKTHYINKLCNDVIIKMEKIAEKEKPADWSNYIEHMKVVQKFITQIYDNAKDVISFRYPFSNNLGTFFYNSSLENGSGTTDDDAFGKAFSIEGPSENVTLDIKTYFVWFTKVHQIFKNMYYAMNEIPL